MGGKLLKDYSTLRRKMVEHQVRARGVRDNNVLSAMKNVPRELFVGSDWAAHAYEDRPLPIGEGQTISQPYIVAFMVEALKLQGGEKVLEIGSGSGYAAAVLSKIASLVHGIERIPQLAEKARKALAAAQIGNIEIHADDGTLGLPGEAPFDAILVSAAANRVPAALKEQLAIGGVLVIPVGDSETFQVLKRITRTGESAFSEEDLTEVRFVPLIGKNGWPA